MNDDHPPSKFTNGLTLKRAILMFTRLVQRLLEAKDDGVKTDQANNSVGNTTAKDEGGIQQANNGNEVDARTSDGEDDENQVGEDGYMKCLVEYRLIPVEYEDVNHPDWGQYFSSSRRFPVGGTPYLNNDEII